MAAKAIGSNCQVVRNVERGGVGNSVHRCARYHYRVMDELWTGIVWSLAPTILVGLLFWVVMRSIVRADRTERKAYARMEAEERARRGLPQKP